MDSVKKYFVGLLLLVIIGAGAYGYYWYQNLVKTNVDAAASLQKSQMFDKVKDSVVSEQARCKAIIGAGSGDFNEFTYCSRFMKWTESLSLQ